MPTKQHALLLLMIYFLLEVSLAEKEGSLRSALETLQRIQRSQEDYGDLVEIYEPQEVLANALNNYAPERSGRYQEAPKSKVRVPRLHDNESNNGNKNHLHNPSPFRERNLQTEQINDFSENDDTKNHKGISELQNDAEYAILLEKLWAKYKSRESPSNEMVRLYNEGKVKRNENQKLLHRNLGPVVFKKKRSSPYQDSSNPSSVPDDYYKFAANSMPNRGERDFDYHIDENDDNNKSDMKEEYAIAFQPIDNDPITEILTNDDAYSYNTEKRFQITKRSSGSMPANLAKLSEKSSLDKSTEENGQLNTEKTPGDLFIPIRDEDSHEIKPIKLNLGIQNISRTNSKLNTEESHENHGGPKRSDDMLEKKSSDSDKPLKIEKKSIDWSQYFGIDKRNALNQNKFHDEYMQKLFDEISRPTETFKSKNIETNGIILNKDFNGERENEFPSESKSINDEKRYDDVSEKLKNMESEIVDEAIHLSKVGESDVDTAEERELKEKMLSRLAAAYSLERMRFALDELRKSLQSNKNLVKSNSEPKLSNEKKNKRVSVKKEKVILSPDEIMIQTTAEANRDDFESEQGAGHYVNGKVEEPYSEGYMGSGRQQKINRLQSSGIGNCPILEKIVQGCRGIDFLSGNQGMKFLSLCSMHQICYLCGRSSATSCDLTYLSEVDTLCEGDTPCQQAARATLMSMQELHEASVDELDGECESNPCIASAVRRNKNWSNSIYG